ncbi:alpha-2-antiplasmin isoform X2 [Protopterus annectens]|uniref:alpha-2-antiplasmin isoform X2 n=1 Tax=Protopterus annectens TaxID=7888 RepID=UPI001CF9E619|nr:alpha-2-antiplasmin isoform X2 [Protopterus annectens]
MVVIHCQAERECPSIHTHEHTFTKEHRYQYRIADYPQGKPLTLGWSRRVIQKDLQVERTMNKQQFAILALCLTMVGAEMPVSDDKDGSPDVIPDITLGPISTFPVQDAEELIDKEKVSKADHSTTDAPEDINLSTPPTSGFFLPTTPILDDSPDDNVERPEGLDIHDIYNESIEGPATGLPEEHTEGECQLEATLEDMQLTGEALMKFGLDLYKIIRLDTTKPNIVLSPLSIALGLSQLALGSANDTEKLLMKSLHVENVPCYHNILQNIRQDFTKAALSIATRIYITKGFHVKRKFLKQSTRFYGSSPMTLTGNTNDDLKNVNQWVEKETKGKIKTFMTQIPKNMLLLLINAIHFKGLWRHKFDPRFTTPGMFYLDDHQYITVDMMNCPKYPLSWYTDEELKTQVARFPFKENVSLIIFLPFYRTQDTPRFSSLNITEIYNKLPKETPIYVKLPKLNLDSDMDLNQVLINLGLGQLFVSPNLRKISDNPLFVSSVKHRATLELKEEGVEAAAATSVAASRSLTTFNVNKPFFFVFMDDVAGIPLFLGSVTNPAPHAETQKDKLSSIDHKSLKDQEYKPK